MDKRSYQGSTDANLLYAPSYCLSTFHFARWWLQGGTEDSGPHGTCKPFDTCRQYSSSLAKGSWSRVTAMGLSWEGMQMTRAPNLEATQCARWWWHFSKWYLHTSQSWGKIFFTSDSELNIDNTTEPCITDQYSLCDVTYNAMTSLYHFQCIPVHSGIVQNQNQQNVQCKGDMKLRCME